MRLLLLICPVLAALSLLALPAAPTYDPLMWLLWGRELAGGTLDTGEGPAFKPLPVAICTLLAPLGGAAPDAWLVVSRSGLLAAAVLAATLADRLAGRLAACLAVAAVALTGSLPALAAAGAVEGLFLAAALGAVLAWRSERQGLALACGLACALVRVEAVPFLLPAALGAWRGRPELRPALAAGIVALPLLWLGPDALATGDLWRSAERAQVPNPGQPALAERPFFASLSGAAELAIAPLLLGLAFLRPRRDRVATGLAAAAVAWLALVAAMAELGFSGEQRYALPGVAVLMVAGAAGLGRAAASWRWAPLAVAALTLVAVVPRLGALPAEAERIEQARRASGELERAVALAGGRRAVLACGPPIVGRYRGPLLAYQLAVPKREVLFDPGGAGVAFASRLSGERNAAPALPSRYRVVARAGGWRVAANCRGPMRRR